MYQYILCLSKLPRAWADILLPRSGVLQPGLQYSKVTTGRVCAFRKVGRKGGRDEGSDGEKDETQRAVIVLPCLFDVFPSCTHDSLPTPPLPPSPSSSSSHAHPCTNTLTSVILICLAWCVHVSRHLHIFTQIHAHIHKSSHGHAHKHPWPLTFKCNTLVFYLQDMTYA